MKRTQLKCRLNSESIKGLLGEIERYRKSTVAKAEQLAKRLADIGLGEATIRFASAQYSGVNDVQVTVEPTATGYAIYARGEAVCFIEFGAGVYYNGEEPYPNPRPDDIARIGEYGDGKGKQKSWGYYDDNKNLVITHGTPAAMPMYFASSVMRREVEQIAREVFEM